MASFTTPSGVTITTDVLQETAAKVGLRIPEHKEAAFTEMLASARQAIDEVLAMDGMSICLESTSPLFDLLFRPAC